VEKSGVPRENHQLAQVTHKRYHIKLHRVHLAITGIRTDNISNNVIK